MKQKENLSNQTRWIRELIPDLPQSVTNVLINLNMRKRKDFFIFTFKKLDEDYAEILEEIIKEFIFNSSTESNNKQSKENSPKTEAKPISMVDILADSDFLGDKLEEAENKPETIDNNINNDSGGSNVGDSSDIEGEVEEFNDEFLNNEVLITEEDEDETIEDETINVIDEESADFVYDVGFTTGVDDSEALDEVEETEDEITKTDERDDSETVDTDEEDVKTEETEDDDSSDEDGESGDDSETGSITATEIEDVTKGDEELDIIKDVKNSFIRKL